MLPPHAHERVRGHRADGAAPVPVLPQHADGAVRAEGHVAARQGGVGARRREAHGALVRQSF